MKSKMKFLDPTMIMGVVVALIILAVGVFAFYVTIENIPISSNDEEYSKEVEKTIEVTNETGNSIFNIVGIVLVIGAIMTVVGLVYSFVGGEPRPKKKRRKEKSIKSKKLKEKKPKKKRQKSFDEWGT